MKNEKQARILNLTELQFDGKIKIPIDKVGIILTWDGRDVATLHFTEEDTGEVDICVDVRVNTPTKRYAQYRDFDRWTINLHEAEEAEEENKEISETPAE